MMHGPMNVKQEYSVDIITNILKIIIQLIKTRSLPSLTAFYLSSIIMYLH